MELVEVQEEGGTGLVSEAAGGVVEEEVGAGVGEEVVEELEQVVGNPPGLRLGTAGLAAGLENALSAPA